MNRPTRHQWFGFAAAVALSLSGAAGAADRPQVSVDVTAGTASGSFLGAAASIDQVQQISCRTQVSGVEAPPYIVCDATDADGERLTCLSSRPEFVAALAGANDYGYLAFSAVEDAQGVLLCESLQLRVISRYLR